MDIFQSEEMPTPMTILEANARINHLAAQVDAFNTYKQKMEDVRTCIITVLCYIIISWLDVIFTLKC